MYLRLEENMSWPAKRLAVQTALALGFQTEAAEFPIAGRTAGRAVPRSETELAALLQECLGTGEQPAGYRAASAAAQPLPDFDWRVKKGLESLFSLGPLLPDENHDLLPDRLNFKLVVPADCSLSLLIAACNFAFRFGMETTAFSGWLAVPEYEAGNAVIFAEAEESRVYLDPDATDFVVRVTGRGQELEDFSAKFCETFPLLSGFTTWTDCLQEVTDSLALKNLDGQLAYARAYREEPALVVYADPEIEQRREAAAQIAPGVTFLNYKGMRTIYQKDYSPEWEVDTFNRLLAERVYPQLKAGDVVEIRAALSEEADIRRGLEQTVAAQLAAAGARSDQLRVLCSYKQGYSWLEEVVVPQLAGQKDLAKIRIAFKPFLPPGVTEWHDEDGAIPSYNNLGEETPDKWYDLPIRYLQELYPAQDMLARWLNLAHEQIEFVPYEGEQELTYALSAADATGRELFADEYQAAWAERPYLDAYPGMGKVHPATGYLRVRVNGREVLNERIASDSEQLWDIYQREVLPDCRTYIEQKTGGKLSVAAQPFFARLQLEVTASEPDYLLPSRNDMISILDALHEDMYFAGTDFFKNYGVDQCGEMFDAPGLILPVIKKQPGRPTMRVTLFDQQADEPGLLAAGRPVAAPPKREALAVYLRAVGFDQGRLQVTLKAEGAAEPVAAAYVRLLAAGQLLKDVDFRDYARLTLETAAQTYPAAKLTAPAAPEPPLDIRDINIYEQEVIGYEQYLEVIEQLKRVPGLAVYRTARSYLGRDLYAVELKSRKKGYISRTKRLTNHPSEIINCRHHANEVASTNAAFMLLRRLLSDPAYREVPEQLNLVIVPLENVDGAAIHYQLQQDNPHWKLHVARFNAIGKEFFAEHFKSETKHAEAQGFTRLYGKFVPDVVVDNHGVPTHEWEQQFSGYTSPSFKGFWLPRSLLYDYFWYVTDEAYQSNYALNKKMEDVVADAIGADPEMKRWNREWAAQFETYAHKWLPKLFPADYYKDMIHYWIPYKADPNHRYPSIKFPWLTSMSYTSEVADETAQGEYLKLCAKAHVTHDLAAIKMLAGARCLYEERCQVTPDKLDVSHTRLRPIVID